MTPDPGSSRAPGRSAGWSLAAEVALVGWAIAARAPVLFILGQALLLAVVAVVLLYRRYAGFRRAYEQDIAHRAAQRQRAEIAGELHDVLGHELSLIALSAGALHVHTSGPAAEAAGQVRAQSSRRWSSCARPMALRPADPAPTPPSPTGHALPDLVERANASGVDVHLSGTLEDTVPAPIRLTAYRVAQEGLTNATKHSPGAPGRHPGATTSRELEICVDTESPGSGDHGAAVGSGLAGLHRRVAALGGDLSCRAPMAATSPGPACRCARPPRARRHTSPLRLRRGARWPRPPVRRWSLPSS